MQYIDASDAKSNRIMTRSVYKYGQEIVIKMITSSQAHPSTGQEFEAKHEQLHQDN
ncbi:MAG: hypothetical protein ACYC1M_14320 [Armatimonadota bacterium]